MARIELDVPRDAEERLVFFRALNDAATDRHQVQFRTGNNRRQVSVSYALARKAGLIPPVDGDDPAAVTEAAEGEGDTQARATDPNFGDAGVGDEDGGPAEKTDPAPSRRRSRKSKKSSGEGATP